jgi:hypothetical protein
LFSNMHVILLNKRSPHSKWKTNKQSSWSTIQCRE